MLADDPPTPPPTNVRAPIPRTSEYVTLHGKRNAAGYRVKMGRLSWIIWVCLIYSCKPLKTENILWLQTEEMLQTKHCHTKYQRQAGYQRHGRHERRAFREEL